MFQKYRSTLQASAEAGDEVCLQAWQQNQDILESGEKIAASVEQYLGGSLFRSSEELRDGLRLLRPYLEGLAARRQSISDLYRVREIDTLAHADRNAIFHIPFHLRHRVSSQRYSISGWPSLYLGASLMVCWEEMGRPPFYKLAAACFDAEKSLNVLDFGFRPSVLANLHLPQDETEIQFFDTQFVVNYLICWPLLAACSISAGYRGNPFIEEYIIPQQLLQWLRDEEFKIDGIRYFSMRVNQLAEAPWLAINYVFPVRTCNLAGHCQELAKRFSFSLPVPWNLLEGIDLKAPPGPRANAPYSLNPEVKLVYDDTTFGRLEPRLKALIKGRLES
jgi:hypothetical protein